MVVISLEKNGRKLGTEPVSIIEETSRVSDAIGFQLNIFDFFLTHPALENAALMGYPHEGTSDHSHVRVKFDAKLNGLPFNKMFFFRTRKPTSDLTGWKLIYQPPLNILLSKLLPSSRNASFM